MVQCSIDMVEMVHKNQQMFFVAVLIVAIFLSFFPIEKIEISRRVSRNLWPGQSLEE